MTPIKIVNNSERCGVATIFCIALGILLFSTVSLPVGASLSSSIGKILTSLPGVAVVTDVGTFALTQVRYSDLTIAIPIAFMLLAVVLLLNGERVLNLRINSTVAAFFVFALVSTISALVCRELVEALKLAIYVLGIACFFSFEKLDRQRIANRLVSMCVIAGVINAVITIWQFGIMSGWTFTPSQIRIYRPDGIFGDSIISALFSDVCIAVLVLAKTRFRKSTRAVVIALCIVAGVVTGARTFYYLLAIVGAYLVLARTHYVPIRTKAILVFILVMASLLVMSPLGQSLIDALTLHETVSSRDLKRQLALQQFTNAPVFGIGTGQYAAYEASLNLPANTGLHGTNPHNVYAQVLCENGLVGFVPLIVSLVSAVKLAVKQKNALVAILLFLYIAISWSLGILYSVSFTSFFIVFICSLFENSED